MGKKKLYGKTINDLIEITREIGSPGYVARQISDWLYKKDIGSIEEMTNLSKNTRNILSSGYVTGLSAPVSVAESSDGTKKYLYRVLNDKYIETAYIPEKKRATVCLSSQAGCKMGCIFCMTGRQGFQGNLSSNEILNQFRSIPEYNRLTNIVYMGMGEPLDNMTEVLKSIDILTSDWGHGWSPSRITVSTVGLAGETEEFLKKSRCHLAVSLHSPFDEERRRLMPVQASESLDKLLEVIRESNLNDRRRISFEYILFKGLNDSRRHVNELSRILNGIKCRINIIPFHPIPGSKLQSPGYDTINAFREALIAKGIFTSVRASRGLDIQAACGLLSTHEKNR